MLSSQGHLQLKSIKKLLLAALAVLAMPQQAAAAGNKAEALETDKVEVVGTTPLPSIGTPINQVQYSRNTAHFT